MTQFVAIQGLQFGSEGKGQIAGLVGQLWKPETVVCANHPNAGHTYNDPAGRQFIHRVLPVSAVGPSVENILIGPGAVVDVDQLVHELYLMEAAGVIGKKRIVIHPNASILLPQHVEDEKKLVRIGSTMKGSMEAVIHKMRREDNTSNLAGRCIFGLNPLAQWPEHVFVNSGMYDASLEVERVLIEGAQGFSLGIHERFYPHCTSRDVSTAQLLADCRIPLTRDNLHVIGVARTYPIRVANRFDADGKQIGTSGPCYPDQLELTWDRIGRRAELTTVTRLPRRIFTFSPMQVQAACRAMRVDSVALTFCDYLHGEAPDEGDGPVMSCVQPVQEFALAFEEVIGQPVRLMSFGPKYRDTRETNNLKTCFDPELVWLP